MTSTAALVVEGLTKRYGGRPVVDAVDCEVRTGEIYGVLGPNGAGKTTLLETVQGLRSLDAGHVRILGHDPHAARRHVRRLVGTQQQSVQLPPRLRAGELYDLFASFYDDPRPRAEVFGILGLEDHHRTAVEKLSGGLQQRLSVALALVGRPRLVFLDELTTGLDPEARRRIWQVVRAIRDDGTTVVLTTHLIDEAEALCDRVLVLATGTVRAIGAPAELVAAVGRHVAPIDARARSTGAPSGVRLVDVFGEVLAFADDRPVLERFVRSSPSDRPAVVRDTRLEDAYFALSSGVAA